MSRLNFDDERLAVGTVSTRKVLKLDSKLLGLATVAQLVEAFPASLRNLLEWAF
jgi:hypothetical protein